MYPVYPQYIFMYPLVSRMYPECFVQSNWRPGWIFKPQIKLQTKIFH